MDGQFQEKREAARHLLAEGLTSTEVQKEIKRAYKEGIGQSTLVKLKKELGLKLGSKDKSTGNGAVALRSLRDAKRPSGKEQFTEVTDVTPAMAIQWLEANTHNRPVRPSFVELYAGDMKDGNWRLTHQGIGFDWNEVLVDGQHRLLAVVRAKVTVRMEVTYNIDPDAIANIDGNILRKTGDQFGLVDGLTNGKRIAATCMVIRNIASNFEYDNAKMTFDQAREIYATYRTGVDWVCSAFGSRRTFGASPMTGAMAYAYPKAPVKANEFTKQVIDGEQLSKKDPAYTLRNYMLLNKFGSSSERRILTIVTLRAFFAYCHDHQLEVIKPALLTLESPTVAKTLQYFHRFYK